MPSDRSKQQDGSHPWYANGQEGDQPPERVGRGMIKPCHARELRLKGVDSGGSMTGEFIEPARPHRGREDVLSR